MLHNCVRYVYIHLVWCLVPIIYRRKLHYCSSCKEGIYDGEEYIENQNGEYRHYECFHGMKDLLEWLGYRIRTMQNTT